MTDGGSVPVGSNRPAVLNFSTAKHTMNRIAIVGGGLTGLAAAWQLEQSGQPCDVDLWEAGDRLGGVVQTESIGSYRFDHSADMFSIEPPDALQLVRELGRESELLTTRPVADRAWIASAGELHPVPRGWALLQPSLQYPLLASRLLSWEGKARLLSEQHRPPHAIGADADLSLEQFAVERFGREAFERLIQPLAAGIYTADPTALSMSATMDRFCEAVRSEGSLIRAGQNAREETGIASGARYSLFRAPVAGMGQLVDWLAAALPRTTIHLRRELRSVAPAEGGGWILVDRDGKADAYSGVLLTLSPQRVAACVGDELVELAGRLGEIPAASSAIVGVGIRAADLDRPFDGFGLIFPAVDREPLIALSFASNKFAGRAPEGRYLVRGFLGGALDPDRVDAPDATLIEATLDGLHRWLGYRGTPEWTRVIRWRDCMPQYHLGHRQRVEAIEQCARGLPGLELAGNGYRGVGIPASLRSGRDAADRLIAALGDRSGGGKP